MAAAIAYAGWDGVLRTCAEAAGLRDVRPGFARSPRFDRLFALGWPFLRVLDPGDAGAERYDPFRLVWGASAAERLVLKWSDCASLDARAVAEAAIHRGPPGGHDEHEDMIWLLEALVGPVPAATALVEAFEAAPPDVWATASPIEHPKAFALGFVLLRTPPETRDALQTRLDALWERERRAHPHSTLMGALDATLHGRKGALRSGLPLGDVRALHPRYVALVREDPGFILECAEIDVARTRAEEDSRYFAGLAFAGGPPVVELYSDVWKRVVPAAQLHFAHTFGRIAGAKVDATLRAMTLDPHVGDAVSRWLSEQVYD